MFPMRSLGQIKSTKPVFFIQAFPKASFFIESHELYATTKKSALDVAEALHKAHGWPAVVWRREPNGALLRVKNWGL